MGGKKKQTLKQAAVKVGHRRTSQKVSKKNLEGLSFCILWTMMLARDPQMNSTSPGFSHLPVCMFHAAVRAKEQKEDRTPIISQ